MYKKLRKFCAWALAVVTVVSLVPSSGLVMADETDTSVNAEVEQGTIYFKVPDAGGQVLVTTDKDSEDENTQTITVTDEKTTLTDKDGNETDVTLTEEGYSLEITGDVESVVNVEILPAEGYEVGTYHILSDTGDVVDEPEISSENKYEVTISKDVQVVEVLFNAVETQSDTTEETEVVEEPTETEEVTEEVTEPVEETTEETTEKSEPVEVDEEAETTSETEDTDAFIKAYMELDENWWDLGYSENYLMGIAPNYVGESIYSKKLSSDKRVIDVIRYNNPDPNNWQDYDRLRRWKESILGKDGEQLYCSDPTMTFKEGWKTSVNAANYYNENTIKTIAGLLYYADRNFCGGLSDTDRYYIKQTYVWTILNEVNRWYTGGARINIEYGNNTQDGAGHWISNHQSDVWYQGLAWVQSNWNYLSCSGEIFQGDGQPLSRWSCQYNPTGSGYIVKTSSNTSLTSGNSNYNLTGATYNIYKTKSDAQNNKNAISGKQFKIASNSGTSNTVELDPGTYYIKEVSGSDGTGYTTSSTIYTITITAGQYGKNLTPSGGIKNTPKTAQIDLYKTPSNPVCVENNENYSLEGAVYGIYTNSSCTSLKTKATTNADGEFSVTNLPLGQYWVKEISPSPGYLVDTNVYAVDARTEGSGPVRVFTVESHETPILDPDNLLLKKVDSNTNGAPEDQGTMEGAEFEVKFYGIAVDEIADGTDPATLGYQPTRTWVLKTYTTSNGSAALIFDNAFKVSGDDFYYTSSGDIAFPFGVITMKETKAPNGYLINDQVIVQKITDANGGNDSTIIDHVPTQLEDSLTLRVVKTQYDTEKVIPGVTYRWTRPDGTVNTYTTDKNGVIEFHGLTWGKHTIEEIDVPDGYAVNTNKIEFTVAQDNTITFDKEYPMSDTNGVITISLDTEGNMDVDYTNKPAPFDLMIHKVNNHNFPLEGAEFTLYSDEKCTQVVDVQVTDSDGELTFADLIPYKEYWMKETDAPPGYRIPVNDDGSDIIWKIDVESVPVNDEFTFNVNDTAYTVQSTGSIWIDGTKADRVCNMTVVNEVGMKLPNTGSSMMILLLIAGVMLMGGAIVISRKSRKTSDDKE